MFSQSAALPFPLILTIMALSVISTCSSRAQSSPEKSGLGSSKISLPSGPGSIEGLGESFEPQLNTGTFTYGVALQLPPGRAGLVPKLRLGYDSGCGNSILGLGWNMELPSIKRQTDKGFPSYTGTDTFLGGGEELVPLQTNGDWRAKNESAFGRYRQIDGNGDRAIDGWEMTERSGTRHTYGIWHGEEGRWSTIEHPSPPYTTATLFDRTYLWAIDSTEDLHGNRIEYHYQAPGSDGASAGILYPDRIRYTLHRDVTFNAWHEVRFRYAPRPDVFDDYRSTFRTRLAQRMVGIDIYSHYDNTNHLVRSYSLEYDYRPEDKIANVDGAIDLGVSLLKRLVQRDRSGNPENYLPPLLFEYTAMNLASASLRGVRTRDLSGQELVAPPSLELADPSGNTQLSDVDADSLPDIFRTGNPGQSVVRNLGERIHPSSGERYLLFDTLRNACPTGALQLGGAETNLTDFDADGIADVIRFTGSGPQRAIEVYANLSTLDRVDNAVPGFSPEITHRITNSLGDPSVLPVLSFGDPSIRQADVNFDKTSDWIRTAPSGSMTRFFFYWYDKTAGWQQKSIYFQDGTYAPVVAFEVGGESNPRVKLADMNGDRLQDLVVLHTSGSGASTVLRVVYWPYCGLGKWGERQEVTPASGDQFQIGTLNLADLLLQDLTGDGLADVAIIDGSSARSAVTLRVNIAGHAWSSPVTRTGLPRYSPRDLTNPTTFRTADLNANGSTDLIWRNLGPGGAWEWMELMPRQKPNLLCRYDNSLGKVSEITYGNAIEDQLRAESAGHPWTTKIPIPMQVVRRIRTTCGLDLDGVLDAPGEPSTDQYVTELTYRDAYYDALQKQFRGFGYAQRIDYGDDFKFTTEGGMVAAAVFTKTPTGIVSGPSLVTRYKFLTGAPDRWDNDEYPAGWTGNRFIDEYSDIAGREEEPLKGRQVVEEKVDPWALHDASRAGDFDLGARRAAMASDSAVRARITPDDYVYTRTRQEWSLRRLYRPTYASAFLIDQNADGDYRDPAESVNAAPAPTGRLSAAVVAGNPRSVSYAFVRETVTQNIEANGVLSAALGSPSRAPITTMKRADHDDYGNEIWAADYGVVQDLNANGSFDQPNEFSVRDDERITRRTMALEGQALTRWIINLEATNKVTDEDGAFVKETRTRYDGAEFQGLGVGVVGARGLVHAVEKLVTGGAVRAMGEVSSVPGDPRLPVNSSIMESRSAYDRFGNPIAMLDPLADAAAMTLVPDGAGFPLALSTSAGHARGFQFDEALRSYLTHETIFLGDEKAPLSAEATYDLGFGTVSSYTDFNGNGSTYDYDSFARLVAIVKPYDSAQLPTQEFRYEPADPTRERVYSYDRAGNLAVLALPSKVVASRVISRLRETGGETAATIKVSYSSGCGVALAKVEESDIAGRWAVTEANSTNRRKEPSAKWQPYDILCGTSDVDIPHFGDLWAGSRPPATWVNGTPVTKTDLLKDPLGREIVKVNPPERYADVGKESARKRVVTQLLPLETRTLDEEDCTPTSPHTGTPAVQIKDGLGRVTETHEVVRLTDAGAADNSVHTWVTQYGYDLNDKIVSVRDSQDNLKWLRNDGLGRRIYLNDLDRGPITFTFDSASNVVETVDAKNQRNTYAYDGVNRIVAEDYHDEGTSFSAKLTPDVEYHYDQAAGPVDLGNSTTGTAVNMRGYLSWIRDLSGEEHNCYDARGRVAWVVKRLQHPSNGAFASFKTEQSFDSQDRLVDLIYPDEDRVRHTYSNRGLLGTIAGAASCNLDEAGEVLRDCQYEPSGKLSRCEYGNGVATSCSYDPRLRLSELRAAADFGTSSPVIAYDYSFDGASNITRIDDRRPGDARAAGDRRRNTQIIRYDDLYRVTGVQYSFNLPSAADRNDGFIGYAYNRIGNMVQQDSTIAHVEDGCSVTNHGAMTYGASAGSWHRTGRSPGQPAGPHALTSTASGRSYKYDANGNAEQFDGNKATWDYLDRLVQLESGKTKAAYVYDYTGRRVAKTVWRVGGLSAGVMQRPSTTTLYVDRYFEIREDGQPVKYVWSGDKRIARVTGTLDSSSERVQRMPLQPGWNLVASAVSGALPDIAGLEACYRFDQGNWLPIQTGATLSSGTLLWMRAASAGVVSWKGTYTDPDSAAPSPVFGLLASVAGIESVQLSWALQGDVQSAWIWDALQSRWSTYHRDGLAEFSEVSGSIAPATPVLVREGTAGLSQRPREKRISYYHDDHIGSTNVITDGRGKVTEESVMYTFGYPRLRHRAAPPATTNAYLFTGKELDEESKLEYFEARYYNAVVGQFLSFDPILIQQPGPVKDVIPKQNPYLYCLGKPLVMTDPDGQIESSTEAIGQNNRSFNVAPEDGIKADAYHIGLAVVEQEMCSDILNAAVFAPVCTMVEVLKIGEKISDKTDNLLDTTIELSQETAVYVTKEASKALCADQVSDSLGKAGETLCDQIVEGVSYAAEGASKMLDNSANSQAPAPISHGKAEPLP